MGNEQSNSRGPDGSISRRRSKGGTSLNRPRSIIVSEETSPDGVPLSAPPPYSLESALPPLPIAPEQPSLAPPATNVRRSRSSNPIPQQSSLAVPGADQGHRRTRSHSGASQGRSVSSRRTSQPPPNSSFGAPLVSSGPPNVGGFRVEMGTPGPGSAYPQAAPGQTNPFIADNQTGASRPLQRRSTKEDLLDLLRKFNTVLIVDDSSSMEGRLWLEAREALAGLAETASQYDTDGIDVHFLNDRRVGRNLSSSSAVKALFDVVRPRGITPTGEKLEELLLEYMLQIEAAKDSDERGEGRDLLRKIKPVNFIILTDGAPTDDPESVIITAARRLDARNFPLSQVGIQFVQIGNDRRATAALQELDDALGATHGIRDIVDTTPYQGELDPRKIAKILLGGINRRIDRRGAPEAM